MILLLLILLVAGCSKGAGGVGIDTRPDYFFGDGPHGWGVVAIQHRDQLKDGLVFLAVASVVAMASAPLLRKTLKSHPSTLVTASTVSLLTAGAVMLVFVATGFWIADLAGQWAASPIGEDADHIADSAFTAVTIRFFAALIGLPLLLGGLIGFGIQIQRTGELPRWLMAFPVMGGVLLIISPVGFAGPGSFLFVMASGTILLLWLIVLGGRLLLRGAR